MLKAAIIQMRSGLVPADTVAALEPMIRDAAFKGADYIQTPEMTGCVHSKNEELKKVINSGHIPIIDCGAISGGATCGTVCNPISNGSV